MVCSWVVHHHRGRTSGTNLHTTTSQEFAIFSKESCRITTASKARLVCGGTIRISNCSAGVSVRKSRSLFVTGIATVESSRRVRNRSGAFRRAGLKVANSVESDKLRASQPRGIMAEAFLGSNRLWQPGVALQGLPRLSVVRIVAMVWGCVLCASVRCVEDVPRSSPDFIQGVQDAASEAPDAASVYCWTQGTYCSGVDFLETSACDDVTGICCIFGTTCIPCGWRNCSEGECPFVQESSPNCAVIFANMAKDHQ